MASLLENTALDAKQRRFVRTLKSSAEALIMLINDVLDLSKAEAGKLDLEVAPVDVRRELEQVVALFGTRAHDKGVEVAAHIAPGVPASVHGDAIRIRQVLGNLVNNAVKFTESGAVLLAVGIAREPGAAPMLEFSVTDTGIGVDAAAQRRIFEAFEQADGSVTRKFGGTGLGLAISRQLIDLMRGTMKLESEPGRGSRFSFRIPLSVPPVDLVPPTPVADLRTLVVGVHPVIRAAMVEALTARGQQALCAETIAEAVQTLRQLSAQIKHVRVILDSGATGKLEQEITALRAAAAPRTLEITALFHPMPTTRHRRA